MNQEKKGYQISPSNPNMRIYEPDQVVIKEGEPDDGNIYILNRGKLDVILNNEKVAEIDESGVFVGEMSTILKSPRTATIKTAEESQITVYTGGLERVVKQVPSVALKIMVQIATRLKNTTALHAEAETKANNIQNMMEKFRKQCIELKSQNEELQKQIEELQKQTEDSKKRKRGFFR